MKTFLTITALVCALFCHGQQTFKLVSDGVQQQSAGVFDEGGRLVRTLFTGQVFPAGTSSYTWDGKDDMGSVTPQGKYSVRLLSHNLKAEWEGAYIGNTSSQLSNTTIGGSKRHYSYYGGAIDVYEHTNGWVYYVTGGSEGNVTLRRFHKDSSDIAYQMKLNSSTEYGELNSGVRYALGSSYNLCSDGRYLYVSALTWASSYITSINGSPAFKNDNYVWVMRFDLNTNQIAPFPDGKLINPGGDPVTHRGGIPYDGSVVFQSGKANQTTLPYQITGLAVDANYIYVAQGNSDVNAPNKIYSVNKTTGSLLDSTISGTIDKPRRMASDGTYLWVIYGKNNVGKFQVTNGRINTTPVLVLSNFSDPHSLSIQNVGGVQYVYVLDAGSNQTIRRYRTDNGSVDASFNGSGNFGQIGGYANNSIVSDDRFYFEKIHDKLGGLHVRPDGGMWVCDDGNYRLVRYNSALTKTHDVEFGGSSYSVFMPQGDSTHLLVKDMEYSVDYNKPIKSSWRLTRQFAPSNPVYGGIVYFNWCAKLSNGSTYVATSTICELTDKGMRVCGTNYPTNARILPDYSLVTYSASGGFVTCTRYAFTGFTSVTWKGEIYQNPTWNSTGTVVVKAPYDVVGPNTGYRGYFFGVSNGNAIFFDSNAPQNSSDTYHRGFHLGAVPYGSSSIVDWKWKAAKATATDYTGDYPANGNFDIGNGTNYPGSEAKIVGDFIHWQHHGEFWKQGQTNMHHLLYKNGLQLIQFGAVNPHASLPRGYPGFGGNVQTIASTIIGDNLYIWHGEEAFHGGIQRWKISGLKTVNETIIPLYTTDRPEAHFNSDHQSGCAPLAVGFTDASTAGTDKITGWLWSFGDGSTATEQNPSHTYTKTGNYTVSLKVTTAAGVTNTYTSTDLVRVVSNPTAAIVSDPSACVQAPVSFTGKTDVSSSSDLSWAWDFGNGQKSTAANPDPQVYAAPGNYTVSLNVKDASGCSASAKTTVSVQSAPVLTVGTDVIINTGDVAQLSASGAERYTWNNGATLSCTDCATPKANPTATTTYTVTGVNSAGCSATATVTVTVNTTEPSTSPGTPPPPPPPPPASPAQAGYNANQSSGCAPLAVGFTDASTAGTDKITGWLWSFGDGSTATEQNPSHTYTKAGNYTVSLKVTTAAGVTNTYTGTTAIRVNGVPAVRIVGDSVGCVQAKARFQGQTDLAAGAALSWSWDFGNGQKSTAANPDPQVYAATGNYPVTVSVKTEDGCVAKASTTYSVKSAPLLSVNPAVQVCAGSAAQLSASGAERYTWNNGATLSCTDCATPKASPTATTTYTVTGLNSAGCNTTATVTVRVQERQMLTLAKADAICTGETVNLKASGTDLYQWVASADIKTPTAGETIAKPQSSTVYTVIGKDALGCFADTASIAVTVHAMPKISAGPDVEVCKGSAKQLTATGGTRYQWQADATLSCSACASPLVAPASNANYIVTGTDAYGCSARDTVAVTVHQPFQLNVDQPTDICIGGTARLSATGADQYSWSPATSVAQPTAGVTTATPPASMRYTVTAKDNHNCFTDTASVVVTVWPIPTVEAGDVKELSVGNSLELKPTYSADVTRYKWTPAETLNCSTCPSPYANPTTETTYTVEVSNNGGCKASASVTVHVICNGGNLFIPNTFSPNGDGRNDRFYVKGVGVNKVKSLKVYNRWGDLVFARENMPANNENVGWDGTYKGQQLPSDVYIYSCEVVCQNNELLTYKGDVTLLR